MRIVDNIVPTGQASASQGLSEDQGITYNENGITYNELGINYGGFYGLTDLVPIISQVSIPIGHAIANHSDAFIQDQGLTYNQAGVTYNDVLYTYGGLYGYQDILPIISLALGPVPHIARGDDIYTTPPPPSGNSGMLIGMLGILYP